MTARDRVDRAIAAAASGPPSVVAPHTFTLRLSGGRRFVAMAPLDLTDAELIGICSVLLREGIISLKAERASREAGLIEVPPPLILVPD